MACRPILHGLHLLLLATAYGVCATALTSCYCLQGSGKVLKTALREMFGLAPAPPPPTPATTASQKAAAAAAAAASAATAGNLSPAEAEVASRKLLPLLLRGLPLLSLLPLQPPRAAVTNVLVTHGAASLLEQAATAVATAFYRGPAGGQGRDVWGGGSSARCVRAGDEAKTGYLGEVMMRRKSDQQVQEVQRTGGERYKWQRIGFKRYNI